jgi:hypothetical protein
LHSVSGPELELERAWYLSLKAKAPELESAWYLRLKAHVLESAWYQPLRL